MEVRVTNNSQQTQKVAEDFIKKILLSNDKQIILALYGNLGAGKTTFVQGLAKGLGIEKRIISPTFVIIRSYEVKSQKSKVKSSIQNSKVIKNLYHVDLYRLQDHSQIESTGLLEILKRPNSVIAIEWPEKMESLLPKSRWDVRFEYLEDEKRKIIISNKK